MRRLLEFEDCGDIDVDAVAVRAAADDNNDRFSVSPPVLLAWNSDKTRCSSECTSWRFNRRRVVRRSRITPRKGVDGEEGDEDDDGVFTSSRTQTSLSSSPSSS